MPVKLREELRKHARAMSRVASIVYLASKDAPAHSASRTALEFAAELALAEADVLGMLVEEADTDRELQI